MSHSPLSYTYRYLYLCELELTTIDYEVYSGVTEYSVLEYGRSEVEQEDRSVVESKADDLVCLSTSGHT
jgi:hypothetical protein